MKELEPTSAVDLRKNIELQVLLPAFNAEDYLCETLDSLLSQTYEDFELVILNDCSTDKTSEILTVYASRDPRITVINNSVNKGIIACRNYLLQYSSTPYIAFADADDVYHADRFRLQLDFLKNNPDYAAVSSAYRRIGAVNNYCHPTTNADMVAAYLSFKNVFANPCAMLRRDCIVEVGLSFSEEHKGAADFLFWGQLSRKKKITNLPDILLDYRLHSEQESTKNFERQQRNHLRVVKSSLESVGIELDEGLLRAFIWPHDHLTHKNLEELGHGVARVIYAFQSGDNNYRAHIKVWDIHFRSLCRGYGIFGLWVFVRTLGLKRLMYGRRLGMSFVNSCLKAQVSG